MKYYTEFRVKVSHPFAYDDTMFNLTTKERLPINAVRMVLREALYKPCYSIEVTPHHSNKTTRSYNSLEGAASFVNTIRLHRNTVETVLEEKPKLLVKFYDTQFMCSRSIYNGKWYTFFKPYDKDHPVSKEAIQELVNAPIGISIYGCPYARGKYSWVEHLNKETDTWEIWFSEIIEKCKEICTTTEI
jgi:hypothetical protein